MIQPELIMAKCTAGPYLAHNSSNKRYEKNVEKGPICSQIRRWFTLLEILAISYSTSIFLKRIGGRSKWCKHHLENLALFYSVSISRNYWRESKKNQMFMPAWVRSRSRVHRRQRLRWEDTSLCRLRGRAYARSVASYSSIVLEIRAIIIIIISVFLANVVDEILNMFQRAFKSRFF